MTDPQLLTRIDPAANMRRYYRLSVEPGLFGDWGVVREWGRIGTSGHTRTDWYEGEADAAIALDRLAAQKVKRGYR